MSDNTNYLVKGLFFDLDGTLCDTDEANFVAYQKALLEESLNFSKADFDVVNGHRFDHWPKMLGWSVPDEILLKVAERKKVYYADNVHLMRPNSHLINFLKAMRPYHTTVLLSTAKRVNAANVIKAAELDGLFDHMIFGDEIANPKPKPDVYLKGLELSGLKAEEVVAFEDSAAGLAAAASAGVRVIKVKISHEV
jgi:beta-phosphoglucomutase